VSCPNDTLNLPHFLPTRTGEKQDFSNETVGKAEDCDRGARYGECPHSAQEAVVPVVALFAWYLQEFGGCASL
jgi:hypothetical protein